MRVAITGEKMENLQRSLAILAHCYSGTLKQVAWHDEPSPDKIMPLWLAELTQTLFDGIPKDQIYPIAQKYGELEGRWYILSKTQWNTVLTRFLIRCIDDAIVAAKPSNEDKTYWTQVEVAFKLCKKAIENGDESSVAIAHAHAAASTARSAFSWRTAIKDAQSARTASYAVHAAAYAAASNARLAARLANAAAYSAHVTPTYLSLSNFVLDQIEAEINRDKT